MRQDVFIICVYYYSLPEFPENCQIIRDNSIFLRDVLISNPNNPHIYFGGQYDPHYEYEKAPQYKICSKISRQIIKKLADEDTYNEIYLLFRTTKNFVNNDKKQYVVGFYNIDIESIEMDPDYEEPVLYAKDARFTDIESSIDVTHFLRKYFLYRPPFNSETKSGKYRENLFKWISDIKDSENQIDFYIKETKRLEMISKYYEFETGIYQICHDCKVQNSCPLIKRIMKKGKLYHQIPKNIARTMNKYYKNRIVI